VSNAAKAMPRKATASHDGGYILRINGQACAFIHGTLNHGVYNYGVPGFLVEYANWSPGKVLLILAIKDLIEKTNCRLFDFGGGGDDVGYKSKLGNVSRPARTILVSHRLAIRPALVSLAQLGLLSAKAIARRIFSSDVLRRRIRRALRS
jgi:CelD/BcsL family acetyltransferase involved in cellulose biosynthesis